MVSQYHYFTRLFFLSADVHFSPKFILLFLNLKIQVNGHAFINPTWWVFFLSFYFYSNYLTDSVMLISGVRHSDSTVSYITQ